MYIYPLEKPPQLARRSDIMLFSSRCSCCLGTILLLLLASRWRIVSSDHWPYLQIYPPVNETDDRTSLYFALVLSSGGQLASFGVIPGVQIALDYINSQPSILPGYTLHYTLTDSQVNTLCNCSQWLKIFV